MQRVSTHLPRKWRLSCNYPNQAIDTNFICSWGFFSIMGSSFASYQHFSLSFQCSAKNTPWKWTKEYDQVFCDAKSVLASVAVPVHYNSKLPLRQATDAFAYDIEAVILHMSADGRRATHSRILTAAEKNYSQLHVEKETLSIMFGVRKFYQHLYGGRFTLFTNHKPLTIILTQRVVYLLLWQPTCHTGFCSYSLTAVTLNCQLQLMPMPTACHDYHCAHTSSASSAVSIFTIRLIKALPVTVVKLIHLE